DRARERDRIRLCVHKQDGVSYWDLTKGHVNLERQFLIESVMHDVARYAHDREPRLTPFRRTNSDLTSNRCRTLPHARSQGLINDGYTRRARAVLVRKETAGDQFDIRSRQVIRADDLLQR